MLENIKKEGGPLVVLDPELISRIREVIKKIDYGDLMEKSADFKDAMLNIGYLQDELLQVPAYHVLVGSTIPVEGTAVFVKRTISNARQEEIEDRIRGFIESL